MFFSSLNKIAISFILILKITELSKILTPKALEADSNKIVGNCSRVNKMVKYSVRSQKFCKIKHLE